VAQGGDFKPIIRAGYGHDHTGMDRVTQTKMDAALPWPPPRYAWYVVFILACVYTISFADRQILSLVVTPLKTDLGLTDTQVSLLQGLSFSLFYGGLALPLGRLADRVSRRNLILAGMIVWCAMTVMCGLAHSFAQLFAARMGVGIGEAALTPAALSLISDYFPPRRLPAAVTAYSLAIPLGAGAAYVGGGEVVALASHVATGGFAPFLGHLRAWQVALAAIGCVGLLFAPMLFTVGEPSRRGSEGAASPPARVADLAAFLIGLRGLVGPLFLAMSLLNTVAIAALSWTPSLFERRHGFSAQQSGIAYGLIILTAGIGGPILTAWWAVRRRTAGHADATVRTSRLASAAALPFLIAWPLASDTGWALAFLWFANLFMSGASTGLATSILQEVTPHRFRAQTTALYMFSINICGLILGPTSVALLNDYVFRDDRALGVSLVVVAVIAIPTAVLLLGVAAPRLRCELDRPREA
jgi:MFS family permease